MEDQNTDSNLIDQQPVSLNPLFSKKRLIFFGALGISAISIIVLGILYTNFSGNKLTYYQGDAYSRYKEGNYEKSASVASEGLNKYNEDTTLLRYKLDASSSFANKNGTEKELFEKNKAYIDTAIKIGQKDPDLMLAVGYAYETSGKYEEALAFYEKAILRKPTADAFFHKGHALAFLGKASESKEAYEKAYALDPENPQVALIMGSLAEQEKKHLEAKAFFLSAAESKRTTKEIRAEALTAVSMLEIAEGDKSKALADAQYAVKTDPKYSPALGLYGLLLTYDANTYNVGTHTIYDAIKQNPRITMNYLFMGLALRKAKLATEAIEYQNEGLRLVDNDNTLVGEKQKRAKKAKMYYELAQTYAIAQDVQNAIQNITLSFETEPAYKSVIRNDMQKGYFVQIVSDKRFSTFLASI